MRRIEETLSKKKVFIVLDDVDKSEQVEKLVGKVELSAAIRKLGNLEVLLIEDNLKGQLPSEIGLLGRLQQLVLRGCYEILESPALPTSLIFLEMSSTSLQVVPDLSNLTNLAELELTDDFGIDERDRRVHTGDLRWIGRLSELEKLSLRLLHVPAPNELASFLSFNQLHLSGLALQTFMQVPSSLLELTLKDCQSTALLSSNLKNLSNLYLNRSQMQEIKFDGLQLPNLMILYLKNCEPLEKFMLSRMRKLKKVAANYCPKLDEIHITGVLESLEELHINWCNSFGRLVYVDTQWESCHESSLILASRVFISSRNLLLQHCYEILSIQVVGTLESLEELSLYECCHLQSLGGLSNLRNLKSLHIAHNHKLRIVEGFDKVEFLNDLTLLYCESLESPIDVSTTQLPDDCCLYIM
ncbi:hypothetical protein NL676_023811 [Syzygium grande]|nr:hypothetical protein NL676_023811 [Syzygium grande]